MVGRKSPGGSVSIAQSWHPIQRKMAEILRFWPSFAPSGADGCQARTWSEPGVVRRSLSCNPVRGYIVGASARIAPPPGNAPLAHGSAAFPLPTFVPCEVGVTDRPVSPDCACLLAVATSPFEECAGANGSG